MANKLKNMQLTSVDMVRAGANQEADICLFKSAAPQKATEPPVEGEKNIFKRFLAWLCESDVEQPEELEDPVEKADDQPDLANIYKSAITESLQSIVADETLSVDEKNSLIAKSIDQYHDAMTELLWAQEYEEDVEIPDEQPEDLGYLVEGMEEETAMEDPAPAPEFDEIEEI